MAVLAPTPADALALKAKLFRGFADPSRLAILECLREGPRTVGEVVRLTGLSQPNVSNHLQCLWDCGLVQRHRQGRFVRYHLSDPRVAALLALANQLLAEVARGVYQCTRYADAQR
ncbi:MAG: metalloregulator ArsR/SmtB family transcription factor [Armatimonadota bacterium]|nr:metalloregulator ArsR/SmtB family transcription factor [Armatimonadota bacterium]MDW8155285.1 metalloregulator ArsR/SmtB family transcription factor [Armatimonadota bacterium]